MPKTLNNIKSTPVTSYLVTLLLDILSGFWWLFEQGNSQIGGVLLIGVWVMALNRFPEISLKYLKTAEIKYYFLPLAILATAGYGYGVFLR